jgi:hypothetical protein
MKKKDKRKVRREDELCFAYMYGKSCREMFNKERSWWKYIVKEVQYLFFFHPCSLNKFKKKGFFRWLGSPWKLNDFYILTYAFSRPPSSSLLSVPLSLQDSTNRDDELKVGRDREWRNQRHTHKEKERKSTYYVWIKTSLCHSASVVSLLIFCSHRINT